MTYIKENANTMSEEITSKILYPYDGLLAKKEALENHKQHLMDVWDAKIAEVDKLIAEADKLGLKPNPIKPIIK